MSNHLTSLAYKLDVGSLLRKSVLVLLADKASDDGSGIWASKQTMADELCCSKQSVITAMQQFIEEGLLVETGRKQHQNGYTITYALKLAAMEALPRVKRWASNPSTSLTSQRDGPVKVAGDTSQPALPKPPLTSSEAKASGGTPPDPVKSLFDVGVDLLTSCGQTEKEARSLIGKWRKGRKDGEVLAALIDCRSRAVSNPVEWLTKSFAGQSGYVSPSGYVYRGDRDAVLREAEKRADWTTYYAIRREAA